MPGRGGGRSLPFFRLFGRKGRYFVPLAPAGQVRPAQMRPSVPEPSTFAGDRPSIAWIQHDPIGEILLLGYVTDP